MSKKQSFARNRDEPCQVGRLTQTTARENRKWKFFVPWRSCHEKFLRSYRKHFTIYDLMLFLKYFDMRQSMCADGWRDLDLDLWVFWSEGWEGASPPFFPSSTFKSRFILTAYFVTSDKEKKFTCCSCDSFLWRKFDVGGARRSAASNLSTGLRSTGWTWDLKDLLLSVWVLLL